MARNTGNANEGNNELPEEQQAILARALEQKAKRDARKADAAARNEAKAKLREQRKAAELPLKTDKEKADDFRRLAKSRVSGALKQIKLIRNLANTSQYSYTPEQVAKIMSALADAVAQVESRFEGNTSKADDFDL